MGLYRKRPVTIEAKRVSEDNLEELADWSGGNVALDGDGIAISTLEGTMRADLGDWIIRGVHDEFYPCKDNIFKATYDPIIGTEYHS